MYNSAASDRDNFFDFWVTVVTPAFPKAKIAYKDKSKLMRFLSLFVSLYSPGFMSHVTTVLGQTVYFPSEQYMQDNYAGALKTVCHEFVHLCDREEYKPGLFELAYGFPQVLAVFGLLAFFSFVNFSFILFILFFVFLTPGIPARYRTQIELNGYTMNLYFTYRGAAVNPVISQEASEIAGLFTGSWYYYMARDRQLVVSMLLDRYERFPSTHPAFIKVKSWLNI